MDFLEWASESLRPIAHILPIDDSLADLRSMIGDAVVVALGEGGHFVAEPLEFRNRLLEYLVRAMDFTAIALESGVVEARMVYDYVRGGPGELDAVLASGITWGFDRLPQNRALIRWLRGHNADPSCERTVNFYGFDVPGSPGSSSARRGLDTALTAILDYLAHVDGDAAAAFRARVAAIMPSLRFDLSGRDEGPGYGGLDQAQRDALTASIADLVVLIERREAPYMASSSPEDYDWAHRAARGALQLDGWLRHVPIGWHAAGAQLRERSMAPDVRDRAQADNLDWIVRREGPSGKVLVFGHNNHVSGAPTTWRWSPVGAPGDVPQTSRHEVAGTYLRRRYGSRFLAIGNLIGSVESAVSGARELAPALSMDRIAGEIGVPSYVLDLRLAPAELFTWLAEQRQLGLGFEYPGRFRIAIEVAIAPAFDVLFYVERGTRACPPSVP